MRRWWREPRGEVRRSSAHWLGPRCRRQPVFCVSSEVKEAQRKKRQMKERHRREESISNAMVIWNAEILPHWDIMYVCRRLAASSRVQHVCLSVCVCV